MTFEEAKQQAIDRSEWVLCHGAGYYTARTPDGRDIIGKGENGVFVGGDWVLDNLKTFKELIDLNNELNDETDD